jgi:CO dehydrogenase/acetyl-CoA synthase alpha subunit
LPKKGMHVRIEELKTDISVLHKRLYGVMLDAIHFFVRTLADIPVTMKDETMKMLEHKKWKERAIPDPTLLPRLIRKRKE